MAIYEVWPPVVSDDWGIIKSFWVHLIFHQVVVRSDHIMKIGSLLAVVAVGILISAGSASAGRERGWDRGYCAPGNYYNGGWGRPRSNVSFGFFFGQPVQPVYRQVVVQQPVYVQPRPAYGYQGSYENSLLASAQARLARLGYYRGYVDGEFGPQTSRAVRNYQIDYDLPVTGRLDGRTLASLGL